MTMRFVLDQLRPELRAQAEAQITGARKVDLMSKRDEADDNRQPKKQLAPAASEHQEQATVIAWWELNCTRFGLPAFALFSVPNAARRGVRLAAWMKSEGLRAGIPDLILAARSPRDQAAGCLFIEMKRKPNAPTGEQLEVLSYLRRAGYHALICWSADEAIRAIEAYLKQP